MNLKSVVFVAAIAAAVSAYADWEWLKNGWRVSGGATFDPGVNVRISGNQHEFYRTPFIVGDTRAAAEAKANGVAVSPTRKQYPNGAWIDMNDPGIAGDMPGKTGYYKFPGRPGENNSGSVFSLGTARYAEVSVDGADAGSVSAYDSDRVGMPGFYVEVAHELYADQEYRWGVDFAFAFQYFIRKNAWRQDTSWKSSSRIDEGGYSASIDAGDVYAGDDPDEDWNWRDGYYGSGDFSDDGFAGYAGPIDGGAVSVNSFHGSRTDTSSGSMHSRADYDNMELLFTIRPYYDVTDWFRIVGTVGIAVSRQDLDVSTTVVRDGAVRHYGRDFSQWDVYGTAGLGAQFRYKDFTLGFDFLARFFDDDLAVRDPYLNGSVERSNWYLRVGLGYSF